MALERAACGAGNLVSAVRHVRHVLPVANSRDKRAVAHCVSACKALMRLMALGRAACSGNNLLFVGHARDMLQVASGRDRREQGVRVEIFVFSFRLMLKGVGTKWAADDLAGDGFEPCEKI